MSFEIDGSIIKVKASGSAMVTEEVPQIAEYAEYIVQWLSSSVG